MKNPKRKLREAYTMGGIFLGHYETGISRDNRSIHTTRADLENVAGGKIKTKLVSWK